jgi:RNA polymerase sigma-70 factor (ECF subfamily)
VWEVDLTEDSKLQSIRRWFWKERERAFPNADAFSQLYERTYLRIFRYIYGLSGGPLQEAEDLTAETYERAWKTRQRFQGDEQAALGWLLRIARNLAIDLSRRRKVRDVDEGFQIELLVDPSTLPEINLIAREQIKTLWHLLDTLPEDVREMIVLRYILGWPVKQIAAHTQTSENNVSVNLRRTLKRLQRDCPQSQEKDHE